MCVECVGMTQMAPMNVIWQWMMNMKWWTSSVCMKMYAHVSINGNNNNSKCALLVRLVMWFFELSPTLAIVNQKWFGIGWYVHRASCMQWRIEILKRISYRVESLQGCNVFTTQCSGSHRACRGRVDGSCATAFDHRMSPCIGGEIKLKKTCSEIAVWTCGFYEFKSKAILFCIAWQSIDEKMCVRKCRPKY